jgi:NADPH-dependent 2,4-dienoyl-CoA reductase/sulfur reductase-like enzyme
VEHFDLVVVGGGLASARAVEAYRDAGAAGSVLLLSADRYPPYHRPPLSKRLMRGEQEVDAAFVQPESWYGERGVVLRLGTHVSGLDLGTRTLATEGGEIEFGQLLIATGATPRPYEDALTLRTIDDSLAIREAAEAAGRANVIGTGFIGLEVAASLHALDVYVMLVTGGRRLFGAFGSDDFSAYLEDLYVERGVELVEEQPTNAAPVIAGIGVVPTTDWLGGSGIELDDGVVVDASFRTSAEGVFAVGDVARFHDPVFGYARRIEHWSNANYQGAEVGRILAGAEGGYDTVSSFFTELFGKSFRIFGELVGDTELEGSFEGGRAIVRYRRDGRLLGALTTGLEDDEIDELKTAIRSGAAGR